MNLSIIISGSKIKMTRCEIVTAIIMTIAIKNEVTPPSTAIKRSNFRNSVAKIKATNMSALSQYGKLKL